MQILLSILLCLSQKGKHVLFCKSSILNLAFCLTAAIIFWSVCFFGRCCTPGRQTLHNMLLMVSGFKLLRLQSTAVFHLHSSLRTTGLHSSSPSSGSETWPKCSICVLQYAVGSGGCYNLHNLLLQT